MLRKFRVNRELVRQDLATNFGEIPFPHKILRLVAPPEPPSVEEVTQPEEEVRAEEEVHPTPIKLNAKQEILLKHFQRIFPHAITDLELNQHFHEISSTLRSRRKELTDAGFIEPTGNKKKIGSTYHKIWIATDKGRAIDLP